MINQTSNVQNAAQIFIIRAWSRIVGQLALLSRFAQVPLISFRAGASRLQIFNGSPHCFQNGSERTNHKNGLKYIFLYLTTAPKQYLIPEFLKPGHKVCLIIHFV